LDRIAGKSDQLIGLLQERSWLHPRAR
jgi:hypothetical protein